MKTASIPWDGTQITRPGIYSGIPLSLYHSPFICAGDWPIPQGHDLGEIKTFHPSISSSGLRAIFGRDKSPKHFYAKWSGNPNYKPDPLDEEMKRHFVLGRATHHLFLGERNFAKLFKIQPHEYPDPIKGELKPWHNGAAFCKAWNRDLDQQSSAGAGRCPQWSNRAFDILARRRNRHMAQVAARCHPERLGRFCRSQKYL